MLLISIRILCCILHSIPCQKQQTVGWILSEIEMFKEIKEQKDQHYKDILLYATISKLFCSFNYSISNLYAGLTDESRFSLCCKVR